MNMSDTRKKKKAKYELKDLDVFEVSLVSTPAIGKTYLMTKAADTGVLIESTNEDVSTENNNEAGTTPAIGVETMNEKLAELLKSAELELDESIAGALDTILSPEFKEAVSDEIMQDIYKLAEYEVPKEEVVKEVEVEKEVIKEVEVEKIVEVEKEATPEPEDDKEEILKGLDDKARALFEELNEKVELTQKTAAKLAEDAEKERQAKLEGEFKQIAANDYKALPFNADDLGPVLKAIDEKLDEKEAEVVLSVFKSADEALTESPQLEEVGAGDGGDNVIDTSEPAWVNEANKLVETEKFKTFAQATEHLVRNEPKLFLEE
jgi:hypothetical protein